MWFERCLIDHYQENFQPSISAMPPPIATFVVHLTFIFTLVLGGLSNVNFQGTTPNHPDIVFDAESGATASVILLFGFGQEFSPSDISAGLSPLVATFQSSGFDHVRFIAPFGSLPTADEPKFFFPPIAQSRSWFTFGINTSAPACQLPSGAPCADKTFASCPRCVLGGEPDDISAASDRVHALIAAEVSLGIAQDRVLLVGISQGAALAAKVLAESKMALGGALALGGWLPDGSSFAVPEGRAALGGGGMRFVSGSADSVVPML